MNLAAQYEARRGNPHEGLEKRVAPGKGFGVFTTRPFVKGEYICEYGGKMKVTDKEDHREGMYLYNFRVGQKFYRLLYYIRFL